jgi:hypothetical protein
VTNKSIVRKSDDELEMLISIMLEEVSKVLYMDESFSEDEKIKLLIDILEKEYNTVI